MYLDKNNSIKDNDVVFWQTESKFWNNYGKIYRHLEASTPYKKMLADIAAIVSKRDFARWLDAGCGPGTMINLIINNQHNYDKIVGIDFDGVMLDQATQRLKNNSKVFIQSSDLSKRLNFKDGEFDAILANLVLSYVIIFDNRYTGSSALNEVLKEMYRLLSPGGLFVWTTPNEKVNFSKVFLASWKQVFNPFTPKYIYYGPRVLSYAKKIQAKGEIGLYHFLKKEQIENIMRDIGFVNIEVKNTFAGQSYLISANK